MKCYEISKLLDDYMLGELTPELEIQVNDHITDCASCKKELQEREAVFAVIKKTAIFEPSDRSFQRIKDHKGRSVNKRYVLRFIPKSFVYAFAAFILGLLVMRTVDVLAPGKKEIPKAEIEYRYDHEKPFADTVHFYHAPAKNVAKI
jgi:anti-sigma factor RsiW